MSELGRMWKNTRMIVLSAVSSALYVALLIPFKFVQIIPGLAELRPAGSIPPLSSILFGPAGAFGSAFGNLIGDFFGTLGPGSIFGVIGNFLYGYLPYKIYRAIAEENFSWKMPFKNWLALEFSIAISAMVCAIIIGTGLDIIGIAPFKALANWITFNNLLFGLTLTPLILIPVYPYIKQSGLSYQELIKLKNHRMRTISGIIIILLGIIIAMTLGNFPELMSKFSGFAPDAKYAITIASFLIILGSILV